MEPGPTSVSPGPATGILISGGLDSSILLAQLLRQGHRVQPLYVRSSLVWEGEELRWLYRFLQAVASPRLQQLVVLQQPVADLYDDHWSITGRGIPDAQSPDEAVYLPGRNALLIMKAGIWCQLHGIDALALGVLGSNPFADASPEFFDRLESSLYLAIGSRLQILRPLAALTKRQVMERACGLPLELTFSCIAPVGGNHCGRCNKCAERQAAFRLASLPDPTYYATP